MPPCDIPHQRLFNQRISRPTFTRPAEIVAWLGAVQAQDFAAAKWALGLRAPGLTEAVVEQAFADGTILRTHVMRPTWHFVTPADIRWLLALTAPRVRALSATYYRKLALDESIFKRSNAALVKALRGGRQLTRAELGPVLRQAGIATDDLRLAYLVGHAELDGLLCSGARRGKQFTYALLDERAPQARVLERDEALAELARRYFTSHGPATLADFVWWSGLAALDARNGLEMARSHLLNETLAGRMYWFAASAPFAAAHDLQAAYLLPNYDEYTVGYTDRSAISSGVRADRLDARGNFLFNHVIVIDGQVAGTWRRTLKKSAVVLELNPFSTLTEAEKQSVARAAEQYGAFLGLPVEHAGNPLLAN